MFALQIASSFIIAFNSPLVWAMFADTADHANGVQAGEIQDWYLPRQSLQPRSDLLSAHGCLA